MRKNPNSFRLIHLRMQRISSVSHKSCKFTCFDKAFHIFFLPLHKSLFFCFISIFIKQITRAHNKKKFSLANERTILFCVYNCLSFVLFVCLLVCQTKFMGFTLDWRAPNLKEIINSRKKGEKSECAIEIVHVYTVQMN